MNTATTPLALRPLFGGALTLPLPPTLLDASEIRQIPDTQEVFLAPDADESFIFEILESVTPTDPEAVARFHFDSLAHDNDAQSSTVGHIVVAPVSPTPSSSALSRPPPTATLEGIQRVAKFNKEDLDEVKVFLCVWRIKDKNVDLILTVNCPDPSRVSSLREIFERVIGTEGGLEVRDWGLFA